MKNTADSGNGTASHTKKRSVFNTVLQVALIASILGLVWTGWDVMVVNSYVRDIEENIGHCDLEATARGATDSFITSLERDSELRRALQSELVELFAEITEDLSVPIATKAIRQLSKSFLPQNFALMMDNFAVANYSNTAEVVRGFFAAAAQSCYQMQERVFKCNCNDYYSYYSDCWDCCYWGYCDSQRYRDLGDAFQIISEFAAITSTVKYLSNETIQSDGSSLGNQFSNLQPDIEETLGNKTMYGLFGKNCVTLANRFFQVNYDFCYHNHYGYLDCVDGTDVARRISSAVSNACEVLEWTAILHS